MKLRKRSGEKRATQKEGSYTKIRNSSSKASIGITDLARALLIFLTTILIIQSAKAATVGHSAPAISEGMFEIGNFTFNNTLEILETLNVSNGLLYVDPTTSRVGIGTIIPAYTLQVEGTTNTTDLRAEGLSHFLGNVTMNDNLTVTGAAGDTLYVDPSSGRIGIGTTEPGVVKLNVTGTVDAWQFTVNGTDVVNIGDTILNTTYVRMDEVNNTYFRLVDDGTIFNQTFVPSADLNNSYARLDSVNIFSQLNHFSSNVSLADNLTVTGAAGDALYVDSSSGQVGIGTTLPGTVKLNVTGTVDAWQFTVNGTDVVNIGDTILNTTYVRMDEVNNTYFRLVDDGTIFNQTFVPSADLNNSYARLDDTTLNITYVKMDEVNNTYFRLIDDGTIFNQTFVPSADLNNSYARLDSVNTFAAGNDQTFDTNTLFIDSDVDRVGIGTSSPTRLLHLVKSENNETVTDLLSLDLTNSSGDVGNGSGPGIIFRSADNAGEVENVSMIAGVMENVGNGTERGAIVFYTGYGDGDGLISNLSSSERMRINSTAVDISSGALYVDAGGSVGIGTTSPGLDLIVERTAATGSVSGARLGIQSNNGSALVGNDRMGVFVFGGYTGDAISYGAGIAAFASEEWVSGSSPGNLVFETALNATTTRSERMRITSTGNVGIGTTSPGASLEVVNSSAVNALFNVTDGSDTRFVIDGAGNVGIGTTNPDRNLHIENTAGHATLLLNATGATGTANSSFITMETPAHAKNTVFISAAGATDTALYGTNPGDFTIGLRTGGAIRLSADIGAYASEGLNILETGSVGIGTLSPGATLEVVNSSAVNALFNVTDGSDTRFLINGAGQIVVGGSEAPQNSSMIMTIIGGDLNVSGAVFSQGNVLGSPFVIKSVDDEPIPICMKNSEGNWVGCMPDENNYWQCAPNRECDKKVLGLETGWKLKGEGVSDEEVDRKVGALRQKFEQGKSLQAIKDEVKAEIGDMQVLNELDDTKPKFSVQTSSSEVSALANEVNSLKSENELLNQRLANIEALLNASKETLPSEQSIEPVQETSVEETPTEPATNGVPVIESFTPETVPVMSIGESQEFTVVASDADNDQLSLQWFVDNVAVAGQTQNSFTFAASDIGSFVVKVLVTDNKGYVTKEWAVTVNEPLQYGITGAVVGQVNLGRNSLLDWLRSLF